MLLVAGGSLVTSGFLAFSHPSEYCFYKNMPKALQDITHDVLELPRNQRLALAQFLLNLDDTETAQNVDQAWDEEIRARLKAYDDGRAEAIPFDQVRQSMSLRFAR